MLLCIVTSLSLIGDASAVTKDEIDNLPTPIFDILVEYTIVDGSAQVTLFCNLNYILSEPYEIQLSFAHSSAHYLYDGYNTPTILDEKYYNSIINFRCIIHDDRYPIHYEPHRINMANYLLDDYVYPLDSDSDWIDDSWDQCLNEPENDSGFLDDDDCPTDIPYPNYLDVILDKEIVEPGDTITIDCQETSEFPQDHTWWIVIFAGDNSGSIGDEIEFGDFKKSLTYTIPKVGDIPFYPEILAGCFNRLDVDPIQETEEDGVNIIELPLVNLPSEQNSSNVKKKGNGGCADCTPPTLGLDKNFKRVVDNGFSYNGQTVQVENWYTDFPLINATVGIPNLVEIKVYENHGINNMKWVQFCLGAEERGQSLDFCEVLIEVHLLTDGTTTGISVENIVIKDKDNLIDNDSVSAVSYAALCMDNSSSNCTKVDLQYTYREETINHMMIINVADKARNTQNSHFNEGINVLGESLNEPPSITLFNKQTSQQKDDLWITYTRTDKRTDTWFDESGIEYHRINDYLFDRITPPDPYECSDPPLDEVKVWKRTNCHFRALTSLWN